MSVPIPKQTSVIPTLYVPTLKALMFAAVVVDIRAMVETVQVNFFFRLSPSVRKVIISLHVSVTVGCLSLSIGDVKSFGGISWSSSLAVLHHFVQSTILVSQRTKS